MENKVFTQGDPEKLLWVLKCLPDGTAIAVAQFGKVKNRPLLKAFITKLTNNSQRVEVDTEDSEKFKSLCAKHLVNLLNDLAMRPSTKRELVELWGRNES